MPGPSPKKLSIDKIKNNILNLAQTSVYQVKLQPPGDSSSGLQRFLSNRGINYSRDGEFIELSCSDTNLPGSSLATHDVTNDYPGVTEKFAYRRIYDETIDFTFYVDSEYKVVEFLDGWMNYATGQGTTFSTDEYVNRTRFYRMNYPNLYKTDNLYVTKFEKNKDITFSMTYQFIGAFPVNIVSMPVSYEASNILKCTASFSYIRYIRTRSKNSYPEPPVLPSQQYSQNQKVLKKTQSSIPPDNFGGTNGPESQFVERDTATGVRVDGGSDGPILTTRQALGLDPR